MSFGNAILHPQRGRGNIDDERVNRMVTGGGLGLLQFCGPPILFCYGLGGRIRTYDLLVPGQVCYRYTTPSLLVSALRFELRPAGTQPAMLPLHHGTDLGPARGLEPLTLRLQGESSTELSYAGLERPGRIELPLPPWQGGVIPLDHGRLVDLPGLEPGPPR